MGRLDIDAFMEWAMDGLCGTQGSHDRDHTLRVYNLCLHIGGEEGADPDVLRAAALLHDVARAEEDKSKGAICHARLGAEKARHILKERGAGPDFTERVCHCIEAHRFRSGSIAPETLEARVLYDADKLDAIGAIGLARAYVFAGEVGARVHDKDIRLEETEPYTIEDTAYREYLVKLCKIKDRLLTATGKRMALPRHAFMEAFFERINREVDGEV